ncbi:PREDICTED: auxin-repressed 12.5 kDa protein isoform X1 [Fragaria vesca subsp. vesca]|uniref:auxin-repressed 12.5 kDa protein isoform X1 n=1 Tax=Fragaria vesca subsp. vesca TaxID=101020 RepID=UPI0002C35053|nr:PREDICTED: auxin-repressed 12.5 kDa protein isoform X1 [Fragaria vesca subsp. vesca]
MGFLHKLWDETLAGPAPESGLGKLRKFDTFSNPPSAPMVAADEAPVVTRSITILRTHSSNLGNFPVDSGSPSESPTTPGTPVSPGTATRNFRKLTRRKSSTDALQRAEPRSPTGYDWMVITALDR